MHPDVQRARQVVPVPTLRFDESPLEGVRIHIEHDVGTLGRRPANSYVVPQGGVSRVHAELRRVGRSVVIIDLGSSGGTRVNGEPIDGQTLLHHGDLVSFADVTARFEDPATAALRDDATLVFALPEVDTGPHLSPRQQQVVELVAEGLTNSQIGDQLGITERTVKAYAQELYDKLGVRNRAGAVAEAWRLGLLGEPVDGRARTVRSVPPFRNDGAVAAGR